MPEISSQSYIEIDRAALRKNAKDIVAYVDCPVMGIVKLNGYGVTISEAVAAWKSAGVSFFGVSTPEEALSIRALGYTDEDILLLTPVCNREILKTLLENEIILTVTSLECGNFYVQSSKNSPVRCHVAVDTGMGRFGVEYSDIETLFGIFNTDGLKVEGIFSHFSASFEKAYKNTALQRKRFEDTVQKLTALGIDVGIRHIANTCAAIRFPETRLDMVRIGSALVGRAPIALPLKLTRVGRLFGAVTDVRVLKKGTFSGYASICRIKKDTKVAIVRMGYDSCFGLSRHDDTFRLCDLFSNLRRCVREYKSPAYAEFKGNHLPVVGRIGSQYSVLDISGFDLKPGDFVESDTDITLSCAEKHFIG